MFQVGFTLLPGTELKPVSFNKPQQKEKAFFQKHSRRAHVSPICFPVSHTGNIVSILSRFLLLRCKLCLRYTAGNFKKKSEHAISCKQIAITKNKHSSNFCEHFEQRPNFASTFILGGIIRYPLQWLCERTL